MAWTRGRDKERPGCFAVEVWAGDTLYAAEGGFATYHEADRRAETLQRQALFGAQPVASDLVALSDAELLAELADIGELLGLDA